MSTRVRDDADKAHLTVATRVPLGPTFWKSAEQIISKAPTTVSWKVVIEGQPT